MKIKQNAKAVHDPQLLQQIITYGVNRVEFGSPTNGPQNIRCFPFEVVTPGVANTEFTVEHNLGYIPSGVLVAAVNPPGVISASRKAQWTTTEAFFKSNVASVDLTGFII